MFLPTRIGQMFFKKVFLKKKFFWCVEAIKDGVYQSYLPYTILLSLHKNQHVNIFEIKNIYQKNEGQYFLNRSNDNLKMQSKT